MRHLLPKHYVARLTTKRILVSDKPYTLNGQLYAKSSEYESSLRTPENLWVQLYNSGTTHLKGIAPTIVFPVRPGQETTVDLEFFGPTGYYFSKGLVIVASREECKIRKLKKNQVLECIITNF